MTKKEKPDVAEKASEQLLPHMPYNCPKGGGCLDCYTDKLGHWTNRDMKRYIP